MFFNNYDLEKMVPGDHVLRKFKERLPVTEIAEKREEWKQCLGREGYGMEAGLRALFLQFWGDYSDREMEEQLRYNFSYRWFCDFKMEDRTPDHTFFSRVRKNMGAERIEELFQRIVKDAELRKVIKKLESFVDASAIRRKEAEWAKRDEEKRKEEEEIKEGLKGREKKEFNQKAQMGQTRGNHAKPGTFSADKQARWGCKRERKYWFGYKRHVSMDLGSGLIERVAATPANVNDSDGFKLVCPWGKKVIADKGYDAATVRGTMMDRGCEDGVLRRNNRKDYDAARNKILSKRRSPGERVFSKMDKRTRYMGLAKTYLQVLMEAIVHNLKRLAVLEGPIPLVIGTA